jgi:hypothetical protein
MKDDSHCRYYCITGGQQLQQEKGKDNLIFILFKDKNYLVFCERNKSARIGK